jgi:putative FmdB family regulatory protein
MRMISGGASPQRLINRGAPPAVANHAEQREARAGSLPLPDDTNSSWSIFCTVVGANRFQANGRAAMPLYSYHCGKCDKDVELLISSSETPVCPDCGSKKLERLVSLTAPAGKSRGIIKSARAQAAREGHLSNFSRSERRR